VLSASSNASVQKSASMLLVVHCTWAGRKSVFLRVPCSANSSSSWSRITAGQFNCRIAKSEQLSKRTTHKPAYGSKIVIENALTAICVPSDGMTAHLGIESGLISIHDRFDARWGTTTMRPLFAFHCNLTCQAKSTQP